MPNLFLKVYGPLSNHIWILTVLFLTVSCSGVENYLSQSGTSSSRTTFESNGPVYQNSFSVPGQKLPPQTIKSIELFRSGSRASAPIIKLGSRQQLQLQFDELGASHSTFTIRISHHNADWTQSNLIPNFYIRGYQSDQIIGHRPSNVQNPIYNNYSYTFPNENFSLLMSGNYMIHVYDYESNEHLFSMPFLVHEDEGDLAVDIEELYNQHPRQTLLHQVFSEYAYPDFINMPQIDLKVYYIQNNFYGRAVQADQTDMSKQGIYRTYVSRDLAFPGRYEFRTLSMNRLDRTGSYVVDYRPETIPPRITLFRDVVNLDVTPSNRSSNRFGRPRHDLDARYADVRFELEVPERELNHNDPIYIVGPFNNWAIDERNKLHFDESTGTFRGNAIVKEGVYDYKYATLSYGEVDDLRLDASYADSRQHYTTLVYYWDQQEQVDRLLQIREFRSQ